MTFLTFDFNSSGLGRTKCQCTTFLPIYYDVGYKLVLWLVFSELQLLYVRLYLHVRGGKTLSLQQMNEVHKSSSKWIPERIQEIGRKITRVEKYTYKMMAPNCVCSQWEKAVGAGEINVLFSSWVSELQPICRTFVYSLLSALLPDALLPLIWPGWREDSNRSLIWCSLTDHAQAVTVLFSATMLFSCASQQLHICVVSARMPEMSVWSHGCVKWSPIQNDSALNLRAVNASCNTFNCHLTEPSLRYKEKLLMLSNIFRHFNIV